MRLVAAIGCFVLSAAPASTDLKPSEVLETDGQLHLHSDGQYFTFRADGGFESVSQGISTRYVERNGVWERAAENADGSLVLAVTATQRFPSGLRPNADHFIADIGTGVKRSDPHLSPLTAFSAPFAFRKLNPMRLELSPVGGRWEFRVYEETPNQGPSLRRFEGVEPLRQFISTLMPGSQIVWSPGCKRSPEMPLLSHPEELDAFIEFARLNKVTITLVPSG